MKNIAESGYRIEMIGNRKAIIDGCDGVVDYGEEKIEFKIGRMTACISGRQLKLVNLREDGAMVEGFISSLVYEY